MCSAIVVGTIWMYLFANCSISISKQMYEAQF